MARKLLVCGATGFIGRNLLERFLADDAWQVHATRHAKAAPAELERHPKIRWIDADLTRAEDVRAAVKGMDVVLQAAATTSGSRDIVERPSHHVTDNAVMNSYLFRACHEEGVKHVVFFSCTVMYSEQEAPVKEGDFRHDIIPRYFGVGWTKVYLEKMCEFYSRMGKTRFSAIRHSNIYGPHDKYDLEKSHVFGATVAKVMTAKDEVVVWGDGTEERDLLHVDDLVDLVRILVEKQTAPFELINAGAGRAVAIRDLVKEIISASGRELRVRYDTAKPTIPFKLALDSGKAKSAYGWAPKVSLRDGIRRSLEWYADHYQARAA
ncbi:MAG TPA: NAD-dependent epimerase/dehydratase family protein [Elusimicrobiota bacterium]|nr:NAD-dependent epimerase/dehydratase family protein [Elusimicrobiota bacterium]